MASMEFKAHHVGTTKIGQKLLNSSQTLCMYVWAAFRANAFYICSNFSDFFFSFSYIEYNIHVDCHTVHNRIYIWYSTSTHSKLYIQLTKLVKVSLSNKNRIHKICSKNEANIIIMMEKNPQKMTKRRKKKRFALSRRHSFVLVFRIFLFEFSRKHVTHTHMVYIDCTVHT